MVGREGGVSEWLSDFPTRVTKKKQNASGRRRGAICGFKQRALSFFLFFFLFFLFVFFFLFFFFFGFLGLVCGCMLCICTMYATISPTAGLGGDWTKLCMYISSLGI
jgi:hypothetical protein